jgi:hypothetical protein
MRAGDEATTVLTEVRKAEPPKQQESTAARRFRRVLTSPLQVARMLARRLILTRSEKEALRIGQFRLSGEVHQWMYDRHSLARLMKAVGFAQIKQQSADQSSCPEWSRYKLDLKSEGIPFKPDSMYMEAIRP